MANPFVHLELSTSDTAKAKTFHAGLFGWTYTDNDMGNNMIYTTFKPEGGPGGGMMQHPVPGAPSAWLTYVLVDDVAAATAKAKSLGAQVMRDKTEVPHMGWFSIITDPTGAHLGLWQTMQK